MILVDTSVWVDHLHRGDRGLSALLEQGIVIMHPFVLGELACGALRRRAETLATLGALPRAVVATHDEAVALIDQFELMGRGLGYIDVHLLASARLGGDAIWSRDKSLDAAAAELQASFRP